MKRFGGSVETRLDAVSQVSGLLEVAKQLLDAAGVSNEKLLSLVRLAGHESRKHEHELLDVMNRRGQSDMKRERRLERKLKNADDQSTRS